MTHKLIDLAPFPFLYMIVGVSHLFELKRYSADTSNFTIYTEQNVGDVTQIMSPYFCCRRTLLYQIYFLEWMSYIKMELGLNINRGRFK